MARALAPEKPSAFNVSMAASTSASRVAADPAVLPERSVLAGPDFAMGSSRNRS
jgi:hypothetical protein